MSEAVQQIMREQLSMYDYELIFIDNCSKDGTRERLRDICRLNPKVKAILNAKNFGQFNSPFYGLCQTSGGLRHRHVRGFSGSRRDDPAVCSRMEKGSKIVCGIKATSRENKIIRAFRTLYYKMIKKFSDVDRLSISPALDCMIRVLLVHCVICMIQPRFCAASLPS
jgi:hypothetical protein